MSSDVSVNRMPRSARVTSVDIDNRDYRRGVTPTPDRRCGAQVTELAEAIGMEQSTVSHQLQLLRKLSLVTGTRTSRSIVYSLYDNHVAQLLDEAVYHSEHLRLGLTDRPGAAG